ncbi:hypothetical protein RYH80_18780 [Halobaculum sp. MBLA0147]|uniref:hypothetical protein n=1 Tax=Halobaculum sp. MBLA0147 TaxID=3079934 RepID=UPI003525F03E
MSDDADTVALTGWKNRLGQIDPENPVVDHYLFDRHPGPDREIRTCVFTDIEDPADPLAVSRRRTVDVRSGGHRNDWNTLLETTADIDFDAAVEYVARHWDSDGPPSAVPGRVASAAHPAGPGSPNAVTLSALDDAWDITVPDVPTHPNTRHIFTNTALDTPRQISVIVETIVPGDCRKRPVSKTTVSIRTGTTGAWHTVATGLSSHSATTRAVTAITENWDSAEVPDQPRTLVSDTSDE